MNKTIHLHIEGKFKPKGRVFLDKKITPQTMAKVLVSVAEQEDELAKQKEQRRELKKQQKIIDNL